MLINAYCTTRELPPLGFPHQPISRRERSDPEMLSHLDGFLDYLYPDGSEMTSSLYALMRHVQRVRHQLSMEVKESDMGAFGAWLEEAQGVAFLPDGTVRDWLGRALFSPQGQPDEGATLPRSPLALARKRANELLLSEMGVRVPEHLPPVISDAEVEPRPAREVAERALALFVVAVRAESVGAGEPIPVANMQAQQPLAFAGLSSAEREYMEDPDPSPDVTVPMTWRYEALRVLLWALGLVDLPPANDTADVSEMVGLVMDTDEQELLDSATLRDTSSLLDALDLHYRAHWAVRQAEVVGEGPPAALIHGVVLERHYALNWLTRFEDAPWDEVDTPT